MEDNQAFPCLKLGYKEDDSEDECEEDWTSGFVNQAIVKRPNGRQDQTSPAKKKQRTSSPEQKDNISANLKPSDDILHSSKGHERTIIHIDIDCFYAQVEMLLNPYLQNKPLGIQQKHIVVTCNYVARERGLTKLMRISDAKKKCPDLVLVNGEDLTKYRDFSKRVNDLLLGITPYVERLGFDENFLDVTQLVQARIGDIKNDNNTLSPVGFVYGDKDFVKQTEKCTCGCHQRLTIGSILASEIREQIFEQIGLTCCAGVAHNKILAKLAGECHKPNQQTVLFPENINSFMQSLPARKIPGVGSSSAKRLQSIGITSVLELQSCSLEAIQAEFGDGPSALNMKRLSYGIDDADVIPSGSPKSISEEDTYHECFTLSDVTAKLKGLNDKLVSRLKSDLGFPQTVRLTIRRGIGELAGDRKESRQCPIPTKFSSSGLKKVKKTEILLSMTLELFKKLVDIKQPFNIKLLNVCLTKFQKTTNKGKAGLSNFFLNCKDNASGCSQSTLAGNDRTFEEPNNKETSIKTERLGKQEAIKEKLEKPVNMDTQQCNAKSLSEKASPTPAQFGADKSTDNIQIPSTVDKDIFNSLPVELQKELIQQWNLEQKQLYESRKNQKNSSASGLLKYFSKK